MCGRFRLEISPKDIIGFYKLIEEIDKKYRSSIDEWNVEDYKNDYCPGIKIPILTNEGPSKINWGFPMDKKLLINGRSETIFEKPFYKNMILHGRCIIPASNYYEWNTGRKYEIRTGEPFFFMAGLKGTINTKEGPEDRVLILTTKADKDMSKIHHRMPVILNKNEIKTYISNESTKKELEPILDPWNNGLLIDLSHGEQISFMDL